MRIPYCPYIDLLSTDIPCVADVSVEWELGSPKLVIDNILDSTGKVSLLHHEDKVISGLAYRLADLAEDDPELLSRAVEQDVFERAA